MAKPVAIAQLKLTKLTLAKLRSSGLTLTRARGCGLDAPRRQADGARPGRLRQPVPARLTLGTLGEKGLGGHRDAARQAHCEGRGAPEGAHEGDAERSRSPAAPAGAKRSEAPDRASLTARRWRVHRCHLEWKGLVENGKQWQTGARSRLPALSCNRRHPLRRGAHEPPDSPAPRRAGVAGHLPGRHRSTQTSYRRVARPRVEEAAHDLRTRRRSLRPHASTTAAAAAVCCSRPSRSASGRTSAATDRSRPAARSCAARSTSASRTSTSRTTTGRPTAPPRRRSGALLQKDLAPFRDELVISTKAGYDMWPGPYGDFGSRKYLLASLDQSLKRMGLDYVDIFYSHRRDPEHADGGDARRARHRRAAGQGALRGHLVVLGRAHRRRRPGSCASWARRC